MIVDAWIQHPTPRMLRDPMFDTLRRWTGASIPDALPLDMTLQALAAAKVDKALITAWHGPQGALASNDEVTISDSAEKDVNMMLLADSVLASDSSENTEKGNLARLNMLRLATTAYGLTNTTYMPQALNTLPVKH